MLVCLQCPLQCDRQLLVDLMNSCLDFHLDASLSCFDTILPIRCTFMLKRGWLKHSLSLWQQAYLGHIHFWRSMSSLRPRSDEAEHSLSSVHHCPQCRGQNNQPGTATWRMWAGKMTGRNCCIDLSLQAGFPFLPCQRSIRQSDGVLPTAAVDKNHSTAVKNRNQGTFLFPEMLKKIKQTKHLGPALLLPHGQDYCLWAGGHTFFWLLEGWSQTHVTADEANHVVNKGVNAQCATQVQVWLLIRLCWAVTPLAAQFGPEPRLSQGVWGAVKQACRQEERGRSLSYMLFCGSMDHVSLALYSSAMYYSSTVKFNTWAKC